jgi:hypothetical protein
MSLSSTSNDILGFLPFQFQFRNRFHPGMKNHAPNNSAISLGSNDLHSIDDSLPSCFSQKLRQKKGKSSPRIGTINGPSSKAIQSVSLDCLLLDNKLNYAQKERIAEAILKEKTEELEPVRVHRSKHEVDAPSHAEAHRQRYIYNPKLLGVVSHSAPLLAPAKKDREVEIQRRKEAMGHGPTEYRWGPKAVPSVPLYIPKTQSVDINLSDEYLTRAEVIAENKR